MHQIVTLSRARWMRAVCVILSLLICLPASAQILPSAQEPQSPGAASALVDILRDEAAREALIAELERVASPAAELSPEAEVSAVRRLAAASQEAAEGVAASLVGGWEALQRAPSRLDDFGLQEIELLLRATRDLVLVIASTMVAFFVLRAGAKIVYRRMGTRYRSAGLLGRGLIFLAAGLVDVGVVLIAWATGYVVATAATGTFGDLAIRQTLYLNAFLAVEMIKVGIRLILSPNAHDLRPLAISDDGARATYRVLSWAVSILGYGQLLLVPIVAASASFFAGQSLSALVAILAVLVVAGAVVRNRAGVASWLMAQGRRPVSSEDAAARTADEEDTGDIVVEHGTEGASHLAEEPRRSGIYAMVARNWHWVALLWLGWLLLTTLVRSDEAMLGAVRLSLAVGGGVILAIVLSGALGRAIGRGISVPARLHERLPRLEARLNTFVPQLLTVLRVAIVAGVLLVALWIGGVASVGAWLSSPWGVVIAGTLASVVAILAAAFALWLALISWVEYRLNPDFGKVPTARERTLLTLLRNAATIVLVVITLMFTLSEIGLDIGPLLASAGVIGLAIGFGAQKLVQDVITGVFIQLDNAMNVGDIVTAGPTTGVVEKLTIRSVSLRDVNGIYHLIPFSSVDAVSNFSRDFSNYVVDMGVAYREDVGEAKEAMFEAFDELKAHPEQGRNIIGDFEWFGLEKFADSAVILRGRIKTLPGKQWGVGRAYNEIVKRIFDARGIEIPFPHTTLYLGEDKRGRTQPLRVAAQAGE